MFLIWLSISSVYLKKTFSCRVLYNPYMLCYAKLLQLCPTLCNPMDYSPPRSSVHGILQARILEWVAIPSSNKILIYSNICLLITLYILFCRFYMFICDILPIEVFDCEVVKYLGRLSCSDSKPNDFLKLVILLWNKLRFIGKVWRCIVPIHSSPSFSNINIIISTFVKTNKLM